MLARKCSKSFKLGFNSTWEQYMRISRCYSWVYKRLTRDQTDNISWIIEEAREFQKPSTSASLTMLKPVTVWITTNWKIFQEVGMPDHLICLLRKLYAGQEAIGHETTDWFKVVKGVCQDCMLSSCLFNLYAQYVKSLSCVWLFATPWTPGSSVHGIF